MRRFGSVALASLVLACGRATAQTLSLGDALQRATRLAYPVRIAQGEAAASAGRSVTALGGILPTLRLEGSYLRSTDPLTSFGFALRQRSLTASSFDPAALNYPAAIGNVASGIVLEVPIFNADAWLARRAAVSAGDAAAAAESWQQESTAYDVARAYYGAVLAAERVTALDTALAAATAHVRQAESLLRNGAVTRSDALIASVKAGETEAMLIGARSDLMLARRQLALAIGTPDDTTWTLPLTLPASDRIRGVAEPLATDTVPRRDRADVRAAGLARAAANADLDRATSRYLPRVNSFGRLEWNAASTPFGGHESWTVGLMASWTPFAGASQIGEIQSARGRGNAATAAAEAVEAQAGLQARQAAAAVQVALARLRIAERALDQSAEAHRIVGRKYDGGLATVVELFDAAAIERQARLGFADARFQAITAAAGRLRALGLPLTLITTLDQ